MRQDWGGEGKLALQKFVEKVKIMYKFNPRLISPRDIVDEIRRNIAVGGYEWEQEVHRPNRSEIIFYMTRWYGGRDYIDILAREEEREGAIIMNEMTVYDEHNRWRVDKWIRRIVERSEYQRG